MRVRNMILSEDTPPGTPPLTFVDNDFSAIAPSGRWHVQLRWAAQTRAVARSSSTKSRF